MNIIQTNHRPIAYEFVLLLMLLVLLLPTIPCSIKGNYVRTALCDLGASVSVYLKRENSGSWNSGLEKEQILVHYSAHLQIP
ncbi:hypothetical protein ZWY2020_033014 [Hordeum vulgare]|nr:hypothetical protein ZWY2020_033014 [Hordeum vulgare]